MTNLTLEEIAMLAHVSRSTVSRVINGNPHVSAEVRDRVLKIISETAYRPDPAARTLAEHRSKNYRP